MCSGVMAPSARSSLPEGAGRWLCAYTSKTAAGGGDPDSPVTPGMHLRCGLGEHSCKTGRGRYEEMYFSVPGFCSSPVVTSIIPISTFL